MKLLNGATEHIVIYVYQMVLQSTLFACVFTCAQVARDKNNAHKKKALYVCVFDAFAMLRSPSCGAIAIVLVIVLVMIVE